MYLWSTSDIVIYLFLTAAIALLIFFSIVTIRMIITLSQQRERRRKAELNGRGGSLAALTRARFWQDMGKNK